MKLSCNASVCIRSPIMAVLVLIHVNIFNNLNNNYMSNTFFFSKESGAENVKLSSRRMIIPTWY